MSHPFRLLTALEKLHPRPVTPTCAGTEKLFMFHVVREHKLLERTTGSPSAPPPAGMDQAHWRQVGATRTLSHLSVAEFEKEKEGCVAPRLAIGSVSHQEE